MGVVNDLFADVDGRPVNLERAFDALDRTRDSGAVASVLRDDHAFYQCVERTGDDGNAAMYQRKHRAAGFGITRLW